MSLVLPTVQSEPRLSFADLARLYWEMTRPRVLALVLFTGLPALAMAEGGWPSPGKAGLVLLGTAMAGAACSSQSAKAIRATNCSPAYHAAGRGSGGS